MEIRTAAVLGLLSASVQLILHLVYFVLSFVQRGGMGLTWAYTALQGIGVLPSIGWVACFVFFLIGFNKLLKPVEEGR